MVSSFEIKELTVTPTGTRASFIKESPDRLRAFLQTEKVVEVDINFSNAELPTTVQFGMIHDPRLQVIQGIPVDIRRDGDTYTASWGEAEEFGCGVNRSEALEDFGRTITRLFIALTREKENLSSSLIGTLNLLQDHLQFRVQPRG